MMKFRNLGRTDRQTDGKNGATCTWICFASLKTLLHGLLSDRGWCTVQESWMYGHLLVFVPPPSNFQCVLFLSV